MIKKEKVQIEEADASNKEIEATEADERNQTKSDFNRSWNVLYDDEENKSNTTQVSHW